MNEDILHDIGLTNAETKVYLALLKLGKTTAGPILDKTGLQNSTVHKTLNRLVDKGYASYVVEGKTRHYQPVDPERIIDFIDEKKRRVKNVLPELKSMQQPIQKQEAEVYKGFKGFKNMLQHFIEDAEEGDEYLFFSFYTDNPEDFEKVYNYYAEFGEKRRKLGLDVKGIVPEEVQDMVEDHPADILVVDFPTPKNVSICNDNVIFTPWEDEQVSFLVHSRQLADNFRTYFHSIWNEYK